MFKFSKLVEIGISSRWIGPSNLMAQIKMWSMPPNIFHDQEFLHLKRIPRLNLALILKRWFFSHHRRFSCVLEVQKDGKQFSTWQDIPILYIEGVMHSSRKFFFENCYSTLGVFNVLMKIVLTSMLINLVSKSTTSRNHYQISGSQTKVK